MRLPTLAFCTLVGMSPLLWLPELPSMLHTSGMAMIGLALCFQRGYLKTAGLVLLFFSWGVFSALLTVSPANTLTGKPMQVDLLITGTDGTTKHVAKLIRINGHRQFPAAGIVLYGQELPVKPCVGQLWHMTLSARAVHGQLNDGMFDSQRHTMSQRLPLTGRFTSAQIIDGRCNLRSRIVEPLAESMEKYPWRSVMLALAVGERSTVSAEIKALLQKTGTAHLLAISGLHISLMAMLGWGVIRGVQRVLPCRWIDWRMPLFGAFIAAALYSWISGFQPPAQRTLIAAGCWLLLRLSGKRWRSWEVWVCCVAAILLMEPLAILSQSLWLSAFAVAALIFWYQWVPCQTICGSSIVNAVWKLLHLQLGLMALLLPLQIASFHGLSWTSVPANILAVPLVTLCVIPLLMLGMLLHYTGAAALSDVIWRLADRLVALLFWFLDTLPDGWLAVDFRWQYLALLPWLAIVFYRLNGWRNWPALGISCCVVLAYPLWKKPSPGNWSLTMLDVGQGLSMVIARNGKALLYDTGLAWPGGDSAQQLIVPWLRWHHLQPEGIILSHEHLDHRGGLDTLQKTWPALWVRSPLGWKGHQPCFRGDTWRWQQLTFTVIWPLVGTQETGNNHSCVVKIDDGRYSVLLTGDIESPAELSMLSHYWQHLRSTLVQVPHHGSSTSSSTALLSRVEGEVALASAARYNAWHFPSVKVKSRYQKQGYHWLDTPHQGQITVNFSPEGWQIQSLRDQIIPRWYHQWFGDTRDNG